MKKPLIKVEASFMIDDAIKVTFDHIGVTLCEGDHQVSMEWVFFHELAKEAASYEWAVQKINEERGRE